MFIPSLQSISLSIREERARNWPEARTLTHPRTTDRGDSRLPSGPFPKKSNIPRRGKSCAVHLHKMFRKLLCCFGGFKSVKSQQFYIHLLYSANEI